MTPGNRMKIEAAIARAVAANVADVMDGEWGEREWLHLFVDFEIAEKGDRSSSITFALARLPERDVEEVAFRLPQDAKRLFGELADAMAASPNGRWTGAQLRIARDGRYTLDYQYDSHWRLAGNLIDKRFDGYLDHWLASEAGAPYRTRPRRWWQALLGK